MPLVTVSLLGLPSLGALFDSFCSLLDFRSDNGSKEVESVGTGSICSGMHGSQILMIMTVSVAVEPIMILVHYFYILHTSSCEQLYSWSGKDQAVLL